MLWDPSHRTGSCQGRVEEHVFSWTRRRRSGSGSGSGSSQESPLPGGSGAAPPEQEEVRNADYASKS